MDRVRCRFCHQFIDAAALPAHEAEHIRPRPDGQQTDYITLPEDERESGSLAGVPRVYVHRRCGVATGMPDEIIRSYLKDPFLYGADQTFCCGCGVHVPLRECVWTETGEDLQSYTDALRAAVPGRNHRGLAAGIRALIGAAVVGVVLWLWFVAWA